MANPLYGRECVTISSTLFSERMRFLVHVRFSACNFLNITITELHLGYSTFQWNQWTKTWKFDRIKQNAMVIKHRLKNSDSKWTVFQVINITDCLRLLLTEKCVRTYLCMCACVGCMCICVFIYVITQRNIQIVIYTPFQEVSRIILWENTNGYDLPYRTGSRESVYKLITANSC